MTTIAYRDHVLAADTQVTSNGMIDGRCIKIRRMGPLLVAAGGAGSLCHQFFDWVKAGLHGDSPFTGKEDGNGAIIMPDHRIVFWTGHGGTTVQGPFWAMGSGERFAIGAMHTGASAEEAVLAACQADVYSSAPITVLRR